MSGLRGLTWSRLRQAAARRLARWLSPWLQPLGLFVTPNHYHEPLPDVDRLRRRPWPAASECVGLDWNEAGQMSSLSSFVTAYRAEYEALPLEPAGDSADFAIRNESFSAVDAEILYCMVRRFAPRRVIEAGGGYSTHVIVRALAENARRDGLPPGELLVVEPYPSSVLRAALAPAGAATLHAAELQSVDLARFATLEAGDVLFIDSSHVLKLGSDLHYLFLEVLPRLRAGVVVHFHDIFLPAEYPREWALRDRRFWNEQYALQTYLAFNTRARIMWGSSYVHLRHSDALAAAFPSYRPELDWPVSFWIQVLGDPNRAVAC